MTEGRQEMQKETISLNFFYKIDQQIPWEKVIDPDPV